MDEDIIMENREIKYPIWANEEKTKVKCQFHYENGEQLEASVMDTEEGNPDWAELMETFGVEGIDASHAIYLEERKKAAELHEAQKKEKAETDKASILFAAKLEAFEIDEVKASKDRTLKSRIRKASSLIEISAFTSLLIMKELDTNEKDKKAK